MFSEETGLLLSLESNRALTREMALKQLRSLCLDSFGEILINLPIGAYPHVSDVMPRMASAEVQKSWTGSSGYELLRESLTFIRAMWHAYERITDKRLVDARVLDYGCGYGRLLRLMMYFADEASLHGCDPWDQSIELCRQAGIRCDLKITDYLPMALPYEASTFDLIYAFSVFTHTSERATQTALAALANIIKPSGVLVITIRPPEYWAYHQPLDLSKKEELEIAHSNRGFAFLPHNRQAVEGDITYGDTSMSLNYLVNNNPGWKIVGAERTIDAPYQRIVYLQRTGQ